MRQYAWLSQSDEGEERARGSYFTDSQLPAPAGFYLIEHLIDAGTYSAGFSGVSPLSWSEFKSWSDLSQTYLSGWEFTVLRKLSITFCNQVTAKELSPPVMTDEIAKARQAHATSVFNSYPKA